MFSVPMISRTRILFAILFAADCALSVACQRVPLLAPSGSTITLTSAATALPLNGTAEIIAQVIEPSGTPPQAAARSLRLRRLWARFSRSKRKRTSTGAWL